MSHRAESTPRRTPFAVRLAYGQLALLILTLVSGYALVMQNSFSGDRAAAKPAGATNDAGDASAVEKRQASIDPIARGEIIFAQSCAACHQPTGTGLPGVFPPLAGSDYLLANPERAIGIVLHGLSGPVTVNGTTYESAMPPMPLEDADVAAVLTYVLQAWGNKGPAVNTATVSRLRASGPQS